MRKKTRDESGGRRSKIKSLVFQKIEDLGHLVLSAASPRAPKNISRMFRDPRWTRYQFYYAKTVVYSMIDDGLLKPELNSYGQKVVRLTKKGRAELELYGTKKKRIRKPGYWDGKYRLIAFDIKEARRAARDGIRKWLKQLGFVRLQNSVWVYPYECREVVALLKAKFKIGKDVLYVTAEDIENDRWLLKEFNLT